MLADFEANAPERADLETILACTDQAVGVIRNILAYVRQERRVPEAIPLGHAVENACAFLQPMLRPPLDVAIRDTESPVLATESEVTQILLNLVQNAMQAEASRITVRVDRCNRRFTAGPAEVPCLQLVVIDDGCGMSEEVAACATDPFFTTKTEGQGTGLGLAIVKGIVMGWSGEFEIASRFERGTGGHYVKLRSPTVTITDNSFDDTGGRKTNYMIDLSDGGTGLIARNTFVQGTHKENHSGLIVVSAEAKTYSATGLRIEGNDARLSPGDTTSPAFVADYSHDKLAIGANRLGAGLRAFETR